MNLDALITFLVDRSAAVNHCDCPDPDAEAPSVQYRTVSGVGRPSARFEVGQDGVTVAVFVELPNGG